MNDTIKQLTEDLHTVNGHPYSIHLANCPEHYRDALVSQATELAELGWTKQEEE